ncbi:MAG: AraC family transcriptional regulator [Myxacorys chilensis ATA2-1-KO14]|jgi:AraC family transcriptional regulator|nr:AraC family transcriptional regulator [Myxacorys chilensis ATA2-1-KO14]
MLKTESATDSLLRPGELNQRLGKTMMLSNQEMGWNGIFVEQYQDLLNSREVEFPATSNHWLALSMGPPAHLTQKGGDRLHESIIQKGDSILVPAGQPSYWCRRGGICDSLHIRLKPELIEQIAEASEIDLKQIDFVNCFVQQDLQLHQVAMLLFAESQSDGVMGRLYIESLTQVLVIHLLRHYSTFAPIITSQNRSLTRTQLQQAIDYIQTHLNRDLSLAELASVIGISPTYFASLFKQAMGISPHQYVIQQRVERAKLMLLRTDLAIADIAVQVGFSSQSHLTQQFKRVTGLTPKQVR